MPNDIYSNQYVNKMYVKGSWYAYEAGPKPTTYTGNIDDLSNVENIRNKALYIVGASTSNGKFPNNGYGRNYAVLTIRYGEDSAGLYIQKCVDLSASPALEYERVLKPGSSTWDSWIRATAYEDSSGTADQAWAQTQANKTEITNINTYVGRSGNDPNSLKKQIDNTNNSLNGFITGTYANFKSTTESSLTTLNKDMQNHSGRLLNNDSNKITNFYQGTAVIDIPSGDSALFPNWNDSTANWQWASNHGCTEQNSTMFVSTGNADGVNGHEVHLEAMQFRTGLGWILTYDRSTLTSRTDGVYGLRVNWTLFVTGGNWTVG